MLIFAVISILEDFRSLLPARPVAVKSKLANFPNWKYPTAHICCWISVTRNQKSKVNLNYLLRVLNYPNQQWIERAFHPNRLHMILFDALIFKLQWSNRIGYRCLMIKRFWTDLIWLARTKQILFCSNIAFVLPLVTRSKVSSGDRSFSVDIFVDILMDISWVDIAWIVTMKNWVNAMIFILISDDWILIRMKCINPAYKGLKSGAREQNTRIYESALTIFIISNQRNMINSCFHNDKKKFLLRITFKSTRTMKDLSFWDVEFWNATEITSYINSNFSIR